MLGPPELLGLALIIVPLLVHGLQIGLLCIKFRSCSGDLFLWLPCKHSGTTNTASNIAGMDQHQYLRHLVFSQSC